jgi:hydrogenase maturation protein HypF
MTLARRIVISGRVQGVGFRPFVHRLATALNITGTVRNGAGRVHIHAEGDEKRLDEFCDRLISKAPPLARPVIADIEACPAQRLAHFEILVSAVEANAEISIPPDLFMCADCLAELTEPTERRAGYPFINCTQCGPRYTIIETLPYDRPNTSMRAFALCAACLEEFENPTDRRFHAQPLACAQCGPALHFIKSGIRTNGNVASLAACTEELKNGKIVAANGIGGYHLICDAGNSGAVALLRARKSRPDKPLAVMFPFRGDDGLDIVRRHVALDAIAAAAVASPERPIVLAQKCNTDLSDALAPGLTELGVFLPYSPLHCLLLDAFGGPLVATSANLSGEPVITDCAMAERRLALIADAFLHHNREIVRHADDSVVRVIAGKARPIRVGRGLAPYELALKVAVDAPIIATGGHMKNAVAIATGARAIISPHIGELSAPRSVDVFEKTIVDFQRLFAVEPAFIACDAHNGYAGTKWAKRQDRPLVPVQHHRAHASALAGEFPEIGRWLTFVWDGVGLGDDGSLWGGEAFVGSPGDWRRVGSLRSFKLGGGERAGREPWRSAAGALWTQGRERFFAADKDDLAQRAWRRNINVHETSAAGRLFDAAACLIMDIEKASYEGQAPMLLEALVDGEAPALALPLARDDEGVWRSDWAPLLDLVMQSDRSRSWRACAFHMTMAQVVSDQVAIIRKNHDFDAVGLTGGVFQNRILAEEVVRKLTKDGVKPLLPEQLPANDGGLAFGQLIEAQARLNGNNIGD